MSVHLRTSPHPRRSNCFATSAPDVSTTSPGPVFRPGSFFDAPGARRRPPEAENAEKPPGAVFLASPGSEGTCVHLRTSAGRPSAGAGLLRRPPPRRRRPGTAGRGPRAGGETVRGGPRAHVCAVSRFPGLSSRTAQQLPAGLRNQDPHPSWLPSSLLAQQPGYASPTYSWYRSFGIALGAFTPGVVPGHQQCQQSPP